MELWKKCFPSCPFSMFLARGTYGMVYKSANKTATKVFFMSKHSKMNYINNLS